jgi:hypothetical protein
MAMDSSHDCFTKFLPAIVTYPQREVSPHAISLVEEAINQLLPLGSSLAVMAANLNVRRCMRRKITIMNRIMLACSTPFFLGNLAGTSWLSGRGVDTQRCAIAGMPAAGAGSAPSSEINILRNHSATVAAEIMMVV